MTVAEALRLAEEQLTAADVDTPRVDAELLLSHVLGLSRTEVLLERNRDVSGELDSLLQRRVEREPLAYVLGEWGFRRLTLKTDGRALVPRPETEIVVERALGLARENANRLRLSVELRLAGVEAVEEGWDLVVANPPYIASGALADLQPELRWEPRQALVDAGLHDQIARRARTRALVLEVGDGQAPYVEWTLSSLGYADIKVTRDLAGNERVVEGTR